MSTGRGNRIAATAPDRYDGHRYKNESILEVEVSSATYEIVRILR